MVSSFVVICCNAYASSILRLYDHICPRFQCYHKLIRNKILLKIFDTDLVLISPLDKGVFALLLFYLFFVRVHGFEY